MSIGRPVSGAAAVVGGAGTAASGFFWATGAPGPVDVVVSRGFVVTVVGVAARVVVVVGFGRVVVVVDVDEVVVGAGFTVSTFKRSVPQALPASSATVTRTVLKWPMITSESNGGVA
jgi:hypothetical protein